MSKQAGPRGRQRFGDFDVIRELGRGGMGIVYEARQVSLDRRVALKVLPSGLGMTATAVTRFHREAQAAAKLHHTNVVAIFAEGDEDGTCYYAMELIEGRGLDQVIAELRGTAPRVATPGDATVTATETPSPAPTDAAGRTGDDSASGSGTRSESLGAGGESDHFDTIARWIADAADALAYAHKQGVIHRDVKPSNLMVDGEDRVKLMDFGLARMLEQPGMTISGEFLGTPRYMSPEQIAAGRITVDHRTDIYSLGASLYELLTLQPPFSGKYREEIIAAVMTQQVRRLRQLDKRIPTDLETICLKAIEKDPDQRYQFADDMAEDLRRYLNRYAITAKRVGPVGRAIKFVRRHKLPVAAASVILVLSLAGGVMTWKYRAEQSRRVAAERGREVDRRFHDAQLFYAEGRYAEAFAEIEVGYELAADRLDVRLLRARLLAERERLDEAIAELERLASQHPEESAVYGLLATVLQGHDADRAAGYRQKAEARSPNSANSFYLRAIAAPTLDEMVKQANQALAIEGNHYPSVKTRTMAYYALKDAENMERSAEAMTLLRPGDPKGYALRGVARRLQDDFGDALADHDRAIQLAPQDASLYDQRRQTHLAAGNHEAALADAQRCVRLAPQEFAYRLHLFGALLAQDKFDEAADLYREAVSGDRSAARRFRVWATQYVADTVAAGRELHLPREANPARVFASMRSAAGRYGPIAAKSRRVVPIGFSASWSPDGSRIAYARGMPGSSAVEVMDVGSGRTRVITVPGKNPAWSPDGRHLAFVRERQLRPLLALGEVKDYYHQTVDIEEEIWITRLDGTHLRRLTPGRLPVWGDDGKTIYFNISLQDGYVYSIDTERTDAEPVRLVPCPADWPRVAPNGRYVALTVRTGLRVLAIPSGKVAREWQTPSKPHVVPNWSSDSREVLVGTSDGLWIFNVATGDARHFSGRGMVSPAWSPDRRKLAFDVRYEPWSIWMIELSGEQTLDDVLGPAETLETYKAKRQERSLARFARQIDAAPDNPEPYRQRGHEYERLGRWAKAAADFTKAIERKPGDLHLLGARANVYVRLESFDKAAADFRACAAILAEGTHPAKAYNELAWQFATLPEPIRDPGEAVRLARRAIELEPANAMYLNTLGVALYRDGQHEPAVDVLKRSVQVGNAITAAFDHLFLAMCHHRLGQRDEAKAAYDKAIASMKTQNLSPAIQQELAPFRAEAEALLGKP